MMKKSPTFSLDETGDDEELYFDMEFPVAHQPSPNPSSSRLSMASSSEGSGGGGGVLASRESLMTRDSRESSVGAASPRERPNSLTIPVRRRRPAKSEIFCSLPRTRMHRVPKISLPHYSVPGTPRDSSWEKRSYLGNIALSGN
jgi:hypothetical protein